MKEEIIEEEKMMDVKKTLEETLEEGLDDKDSTYHEGYKLGFLEGIEMFREEIERILRDKVDDSYDKGFIDGLTTGESKTIADIKHRLESGENIEEIMEDLYGDMG